jgi:hypothetical protein
MPFLPSPLPLGLSQLSLRIVLATEQRACMPQALRSSIATGLTLGTGFLVYFRKLASRVASILGRKGTTLSRHAS